MVLCYYLEGTETDASAGGRLRESGSDSVSENIDTPKDIDRSKDRDRPAATTDDLKSSDAVIGSTQESSLLDSAAPSVPDNAAGKTDEERLQEARAFAASVQKVVRRDPRFIFLYLCVISVSFLVFGPTAFSRDNTPWR
jgi:hypothetical protein